MVCKDVLELAEPIAAGDLQPAENVRAHLESCPRCAGALASARRLEAALSALETPPAPETFTPSVLQRIRRERWRSEQHVDRLFNVAIAAALVLVVGGVAAMLNIETIFVLTASAWTLLKDSTREALQQAVPAISTYVAAVGLLVSALAMWWWADRRLQF